MPTEFPPMDRGWELLQKRIAEMKRDREQNQICKQCGKEIPMWARAFNKCPDCRFGLEKINAD